VTRDSYTFRPDAAKPVSELAAANPLALIPAGSFWMGSPDTEAERDGDETRHQVSLKAFLMGRYEVTQELYAMVMGKNPSYFSSGSDAARRPVERVSWYDAVEFCNRLSLYEGLEPA
jgi:formylglycine-generating enzyme required for sulfatase activity